MDGRAIFVGSFNLDPRSSKLNTEMGLIIESPTLASRLAAAVDGAYPNAAYRVTLDGDGNMKWQDGTGNVYDVDPETSWATRAFIGIGSLFPVDWLL